MVTIEVWYFLPKGFKEIILWCTTTLVEVSAAGLN